MGVNFASGKPEGHESSERFLALLEMTVKRANHDNAVDESIISIGLPANPIA